MLNGFMKLGVSFMALFFGTFFITALLNVGALALLLPVIWFYAFFDCINRRFLDDEEFYIQEDHYLISPEKIRGLRFLDNQRLGIILGVLLIFIGICALWGNIILPALSSIFYLPYWLENALWSISYRIPQLFVAAFVIWVGVVLIRGKKRQLQAEGGGESPRKPEGEGGAKGPKTPYGGGSNPGSYYQAYEQAYRSGQYGPPPTGFAGPCETPYDRGGAVPPQEGSWTAPGPEETGAPDFPDYGYDGQTQTPMEYGVSSQTSETVCPQGMSSETPMPGGNAPEERPPLQEVIWNSEENSWQKSSRGEE